MGRIEKISIALPEEMLQSVKEAVDSGQYASTSEVIRDALRGWKLREPLRKVLAFSDLLVEEEGERLSAQAHDYVLSISAATRRMPDRAGAAQP